MNGVAGLHTTRQSTIYCIIFTQKRFVQCTNEILGKGLLGFRSFHQHHLQTHVAGFHFFVITKISLACNLTKQQQQLRLTVCQSVTLNMVAVVVKIHREPTAQSVAIRLGQWLDILPSLQCTFQFLAFHIPYLPPLLVVLLPPKRLQNYKK